MNINLIDAILNGIEKLLTIVNTWNRLLVLAALIVLAFSSGLFYRILQSQEFMAEIGTPRIERVSGWCYQQRVRGDRRIVGIQFPIPDYLVELGIKQNLVALVFEKPIDENRFNQLCAGLLSELSQLRVQQLYKRPELQKTLQDFYLKLEDPATIKPLKKSEIERGKK